MGEFVNADRWGNKPWTVDFRPSRRSLPDEVDFAVVGGGFSGLSTAAWLRKLEPGKTVAVFESGSIGAGSSGHTGGMALGETAAGDLPGLGDVLAGFSSGLKELEVECDLTLPGVWEIGRSGSLPNSPISWTDSGNVRAVKEVPGGSIDPGKLVSGLARSAERSSAMIFENTPVEHIAFAERLRLQAPGGEILAGKVLLATNAMSLELSDMAGNAQPKFTLALATEPLTTAQHKDLGLDSGKPFYTTDFPYLWGRMLRTGGIVFGSGLVHVGDWREFAQVDIETDQAAELMKRLEVRVHGLHPVLKDVRITHRWGGPMLIANAWRPVFSRHAKSPNVFVLGAFSGHGVALSGYLGHWAAEVMCGRRELPHWEASSEFA